MYHTFTCNVIKFLIFCCFTYCKGGKPICMKFPFDNNVKCGQNYTNLQNTILIHRCKESQFKKYLLGQSHPAFLLKPFLGQLNLTQTQNVFDSLLHSK